MGIFGGLVDEVAAGVAAFHGFGAAGGAGGEDVLVGFVGEEVFDAGDPRFDVCRELVDAGGVLGSPFALFEGLEAGGGGGLGVGLPACGGGVDFGEQVEGVDPAGGLGGVDAGAVLFAAGDGFLQLGVEAVEVGGVLVVEDEWFGVG